MPPFNFADVPGQFQKGREFAAANQQQAENLSQSQFKGGQVRELDALRKNIRSALTLQAVPDDQKAAHLSGSIASGEAEGRDMTQSKKALELVTTGRLDELKQGTQQLLKVSERMGELEPSSAPKGFTLGQGQQRFDAQGNLVASGPEKQAPGAGQFTIGNQRFDAEGNVIATGVVAQEERPNVAPVEIPPVLVSGLSNEVAEKGSAAFTAAGGGKDGLTAFQKIVDAGSEQERRVASPQILKSSFPKASSAEMAQLQATMDSSKTTQEGLKLAGKLRAEQRRDKKGKVFQDRAVELLDRILANDELDDVLGSVEGSIDFRLQDSEAELISDIEEAGNILTADNLNLMTGVLSESDIKILKNLAGGGLIRTRSLDRFTSDVARIRDKLSSQLIVTADDAAKDRAVVEQQVNPAQQVGRFTVRVK